MLFHTDMATMSRGVTVGKDERDSIRLIYGAQRGSWLNVASNELSVIVCLQGDIHLNGGLQPIILAKGLMWINSGQDVRVNSIGDARWIAICCTGKKYQQLLGNLSQADIFQVTCLETINSQTEEICQHISNEIQIGKCSEALAQKIIEYLARLVQENVYRTTRSPGRTEQAKRLAFQRLLKVRNKIAIDPSSITRIPEMAAQANYSEWHFIRIFHKVFGETPLDYSQRFRLAHAKHLLVSSRLSVSEIARHSGYETFSAFCRSFRSHYGLTASAIRNHRSQKSIDSIGKMPRQHLEIVK